MRKVKFEEEYEACKRNKKENDFKQQLEQSQRLKLNKDNVDDGLQKEQEETAFVPPDDLIDVDDDDGGIFSKLNGIVNDKLNGTKSKSINRKRVKGNKNNIQNKKVNILDD